MSARREQSSILLQRGMSDREGTCGRPRQPWYSGTHRNRRETAVWERDPGGEQETLWRALTRPGKHLTWMIVLAGAWQLTLAQTDSARPLITTAPDSRHLVQLSGNTRPEANSRNDRGPVPDTLAMEHMQLLLKRPAERQSAFERYTEDVQDAGSPSFHHWLSPAEIAQRFGPAEQDIDAITRWLQQQGLQVNAVSASGLTIDFSGTAAQVQKAFHTPIHYLDVSGQRHIANMTDPVIPAALAPAVAGIVSLNDLRPHPQQR
jgi:hypothetical protein